MKPSIEKMWEVILSYRVEPSEWEMTLIATRYRAKSADEYCQEIKDVAIHRIYFKLYNDLCVACGNPH